MTATVSGACRLVWVSQAFEGVDGLVPKGDELIVVEQCGIHGLSVETGAVRWSIQSELLKSDGSSIFAFEGDKLHIESPWNYHAVIKAGQLLELRGTVVRDDNLEWAVQSKMPFELVDVLIDHADERPHVPVGEPDGRKWRIAAIRNDEEIFAIDGHDYAFGLTYWYHESRLFVAGPSGEVFCVVPEFDNSEQCNNMVLI